MDELTRVQGTARLNELDRLAEYAISHWDASMRGRLAEYVVSRVQDIVSEVPKTRNAGELQELYDYIRELEPQPKSLILDQVMAIFEILPVEQQQAFANALGESRW